MKHKVADVMMFAAMLLGDLYRVNQTHEAPKD